MATHEPKPENAIRPSKPGEKEKPVPAVEKQTAEKPTKKRAQAPPVPDHIRKRFVQVGAKYFFPDGARAFTDRGHRLTTPSENTEVIKSLVTIAHARGWNEITVTGTERFRRDSWHEARLLGLEVRGYKSNEIENERLERALARREKQPAAANAAPSATEPVQAKTPRRGKTNMEASMTHNPGSEAQIRGTLITGHLVEHGRDTYKHQPSEPLSYFVKLESARGERTVWGVDLERALKESQTKPGVGEEVGLRAVREEPVTVKARRQDAQGLEDLATHRNRWIIEKRGFFDDRAVAASIVRDPKIDAKEAVRKHPELASTYLHLKGAQEVAARRIRNPEDQRKFVALVRTALADSVERGEPLPQVKLRKTSAEPVKNPQTPARVPGPTR